MISKVRKLNLGCGQFPKQDYINVDIDTKSGADIICDLKEVHFPFKDKSFSLIVADHVLEHLDAPFRATQELWRILVPGGTLIIRVPHFTRGFSHPDHKRGFDITFPYYFNPLFKGGYCGIEFKLVKMRLRWFAQEYLKKTVLSSPAYIICKILGKILDLFANFSLPLCSRLWGGIVGGFEEIEFIFLKPKL